MARYAFVLGSNGSEGCGRLRYAAADAARVAEVMGGPRYQFDVVRPSKPADPYQIKRELDRVAKSCAEDDELLIYFSGHGELLAGDLMLVLDGSVPGDETTYLPVSWVRESRGRSVARRRLIILDCCHAEAAIGAKRTGAVDLADIGVDAKTEAMLLASRKLELAREFRHLKGSFLTTELCSFLAGSVTETVSLTDLMRHLYTAARRHNAKASSSRPAVPIPFLNGSQQGEFFFTAAQHPDLSRFFTIRDQGPEGSPVSVAVVAAVEASLAAKGRSEKLSARHLREKSRAAGELSQGDTGENFEPVMFIVEHFGIVPESAWPYKAGETNLPKGKTLSDLERSSRRVRARCFRLQGLRDVRASLEFKRPVLASVHVFDTSGWSNASKGRIVAPKQKDRTVGGHAITLVAHDGRGFRFANTWGPEWGDGGFGWMSEETAAALVREDQLWSIEAVVA